MKRSGISLIEILVVVAVISILLTIGAMAFQRYTATSELRAAQQIVVQTINKARSDSRKLSQNKVVRWTSTGITSDFAVTAPATPKYVSLSDSGRVSITTTPTSVTYTAPNGRRSDTTTLTITLRGRNNLQATVNIIGVTGKAFAK